jgi:hypothetical protein
MRAPSLTPLRALGLVILLGAACSPDRTMLVVRVQSNLSIPDGMDSLRVVVTHAGKDIQSLPFSLTSGHTLPLQVGLLSPSGGGADVEITVSGLLGKNAIVSQNAVTSFVKGKSLVLDMFLAAECEGFDCQDPDKTCTKGQVCVNVTRIAATLPPFDPHPPHDAAAGVTDAGSSDAKAGAGGTGGSNDAMTVDQGSGGGAGGGTGGGAGGDTGSAGSPDASDMLDAPTKEVAPEVPACVPKTEDCFNGADDDCDGLPDCADPDCMPTTVCVPRPSGAVGTPVDATAACPAGFAAAAPTLLNGGLTAGSSCASGCRCGAGQTGCSADLYTQLDAPSCSLNTGGKYVYTMSTADPNLCPIPDMNTTNVYGARLTPWNVTTTGCAASGAPVKPPVTWGVAKKFCVADKATAGTGNGCQAGQVCMPKAGTGGACLLLDAAGTCPASAAKTEMLYTGVMDSRTCAACTCGATGSSCANLVVQMGSDYGCGVDYDDLRGGAASCATQAFGVYVPGYKIVGAPTAPTCTPTSATSGFLGATGPRTICCVP